MVGCYCSEWNGGRLCHATLDAAIFGCGRVSGISMLFQDPCATCARVLSRVRQRRHLCWNETRAGGRNAWRRPVDGKLRMADGLPGNWPGELGLVASLA